MAARFWVGGAGTWDSTTQTNWAATSNGAGGASVPAATDSVTFDASSGAGTCTVAATINGSNTIVSLTCGLMGMTLDFATNNPSLTLGSINLSGTGTKTVNLGSGTFTLTTTVGNTWEASTASNLTLNAGTSTILLSATATGARSINLGSGKTLNNVTVTNSTPSAMGISFGSAATISGTLTLTNCLDFTMGNTGTMTIANFVYSGTVTNQALLSSSSGIPVTLSTSGTNTLDHVTVQNITKAGTGSISVTNGFDAGGNTGVTITPPTAASGGQVIGS
jgi:hypothetical protein